MKKERKRIGAVLFSRRGENNVCCGNSCGSASAAGWNSSRDFPVPAGRSAGGLPGNRRKASRFAFSFNEIFEKEIFAVESTVGEL